MEEMKKTECDKKIEEYRKKIKEEQQSVTKKFTNKLANLFYEYNITDELEQQMLFEKIKSEVVQMNDSTEAERKDGENANEEK